MFEAGDVGEGPETPDEPGATASSPPDPSDRLWRHPSEFHRIGPPSNQPFPGISTTATAIRSSVVRRPGRYSFGTVVVAGSMGALAMFGTLVATGTIGGAARSAAVEAITSDGSSSAVAKVPDGAVTVRVSNAAGSSYASGLVLDGQGDVVTTLNIADAGVEAAVSTGHGWTDVVVVGADPLTGLTVVRPARATLASSTRTATGRAATAVGATSTPELGTSVRLIRPDATTATTTSTSSRVVRTSATLTVGGQVVVGLTVLTAPVPPGPTDLAVDPRTGRIAALIVPVDDDARDELSYGVPADTAVAVGRTISASADADHAVPDADVTVRSDGVVVTAAAADSGLTTGDVIVALDDHDVTDWTGLVGAVITRRPGDRVHAEVIRDQRRQAVQVRLRSVDAPTTTDASPTTPTASTTDVPTTASAAPGPSHSTITTP